MLAATATGRSRGALAFAVLALAIGARAEAQTSELRIEVVGVGGWPDTVSALQHDPHAEGAHLSVRVIDAVGHRARCGGYALTLDEAGARAFRVGACDPSDDATELVLVSRTDLFSHDGVVPRPRAVTLMATEVRHGDATGGAEVTGGSALDCSVGIRPYLDDLEHGTVVYLRGDRFAVRPTDTAVSVQAVPDGWSLHAHARESLTIVYDVIDRQTGEVVLQSEATLLCSSVPSDGDPALRRPAAPSVPSDPASRVVVLSGDDPGRAAEVIGMLDVASPGYDTAAAMRLLRERAAALHADAVVGVELHHGTRGGPPRLSGLAVRYLE
jgi:hypothetical protein